MAFVHTYNISCRYVTETGFFMVRNLSILFYVKDNFLTKIFYIADDTNIHKTYRNTER